MIVSSEDFFDNAGVYRKDGSVIGAEDVDLGLDEVLFDRVEQLDEFLKGHSLLRPLGLYVWSLFNAGERDMIRSGRIECDSVLGYFVTKADPRAPLFDNVRTENGVSILFYEHDLEDSMENEDDEVPTSENA